MAVLTKEKAAEQLAAYRANRYALGAKEGDETDQALVIAMAALGAESGLVSCIACVDKGEHDPHCWYCLGTGIDPMTHPEVEAVAKRALGWPA